MVLHPLGNEIKKKTPETCSQEVKDTVIAISDKFKNVKMIVSLGLPRSDASLNRKVEKINVLIKENINNRKNVYLCDNANLFYRGEAQRGVLKDDGLHVTNMGTQKLGRNLKDALWDMYDLPLVTSETRVEDRAPYKDKKTRDTVVTRVFNVAVTDTTGTRNTGVTMVISMLVTNSNREMGDQAGFQRMGSTVFLGEVIMIKGTNFCMRQW